MVKECGKVFKIRDVRGAKYRIKMLLISQKVAKRMEEFRISDFGWRKTYSELYN